MTLETGTRLGPYEITAPLGSGGMGEVFRARDTRLGRDVAVKVLPQHLSANPEVRARFEREAKTISSLNHPNICTLFDVGREGDTDYLVMELVEGETLAQRLQKGALSGPEVLTIGGQIADALEQAHRAGVVHRDLKPGNVMLTKSGAKLMDFGLARATGMAGPAEGSGVTVAALTQSPTVAGPLTAEGTIVGTFQYMAPEQLEGNEADARSDLWALGCVLYEMATGRRAFEGKSQASLIGSIMGSQPAPISQIAPMSPPGLERLVQACLAKDPAERLQSAHDMRMQLAWLAEAGSQAGVPAPSGAAARSRRMLEWARLAAVALLAAAVTWLVPRAFRDPVRVEVSRFEIPQPDGVTMIIDGASPKLSPDGRTLAFLATDSTGESHIWLRPLESTVAKPIPGTDRAGYFFFWSPDSHNIAFVADEKLRKIAVAGGEAGVVCPVKAFRGGSWSREGVILIAPTSNGPIYRVPERGGEPQPVTTLDPALGETAHRFPQFLPDGRHFLFSSLPGRDGKFEIYVGSLDSPERRLLLSAGTGVTWAPPDHLLYARDGKLMAQGFDAEALELRGDPVPLGDAVTGTLGSGGPIASASGTGSVAYGTFRATNQRLAWVDLSGREIAPIPVEPGPYSLPSLSPDGRRAVLARTEEAGASDLWIADLERGVVTRFTDEPGTIAPAWSPDGTRIAYLWADNSPQVLKVKSLVGNTLETFLDSDPLFKRSLSWTPDGRGIIYSRLDPQTQWDLWVLPLDGDRTPRAYLKTRFDELNASVSRDGRWIAYLSDESGRQEAYVQSFPDPGGKYQVTTGGASWVDWSPDGRYLAYGLSSDQLHGLEAEVQGGSEFRLGPPRVFVTFPKDGLDWSADHEWQRALTLLPAEKDPTRSITVVLDGIPSASGR